MNPATEKSKRCFRLKYLAEDLWRKGMMHQSIGKVVLANMCYAKARAVARKADLIAQKGCKKLSVTMEKHGNELH